MPNYPVKLSASKIQKLESCSAAYKFRYEDKLPEKTNSGAQRGTVVHGFFECLLNPRHRKHFNAIIKKNDPCATKSLKKLLLKLANRNNVCDKENLDIIKKMIIVGVNHSFFPKDAIKIEAEKEFKFASKKVIINGFIDKTNHFKDYIEIEDWKSSKEPYEKEELDGNLQAMMYALAIYKETGKIPKVTFLFLRHPDNIKHSAPKLTEEQLAGFETYLESLADYLVNFDKDKFWSNMAADNPDKKWLCGWGKKGQLKKDGNPYYACQYKHPFEYFALIDDKRQVVKTAFEKEELLAAKGQKIEKRSFMGCPKFNKDSWKYLAFPPKIL